MFREILTLFGPDDASPLFAVNVTVHVSASWTVSCHDPFGVGHETVGAGGVFDATRIRVAPDHAPYTDDA
jgi:hypothetical protein